MRCIVIEDEVPAQLLLQKYIVQTTDLKLLGAFGSVSKVPSSLWAQADLIFLDIQLPGVNGIDFLKSVQLKAKVVVTTAYRDYAIDAFEEAVVDYLLKPFGYDRFLKAVFRVRTVLEEKPTLSVQGGSEEAPLFIYTDKTHHKVFKSDILFLQAQVDYVAIFYGDKRLLVQDSMLKWEKKLSETHFMRVHRSYLVNLEKITAVQGRHTLIIGQHKVPVAKSYREALSNRLQL